MPRRIAKIQDPHTTQHWWGCGAAASLKFSAGGNATWCSDCGREQVVLLVKNLPANAGDVRDKGSIPGLGRSRGERNGKPLQYSCLKNPMDSGAWRATVHRVAKSQTWLKWLCSDMSTDILITIRSSNQSQSLVFTQRSWKLMSTQKPWPWEFIAALFIIAKIWKQPRYPSVGDWINILWYNKKTEYYSVLKRNEQLSHEKDM